MRIALLTKVPTSASYCFKAGEVSLKSIPLKASTSRFMTAERQALDTFDPRLIALMQPVDICRTLSLERSQLSS